MSVVRYDQLQNSMPVIQFTELTSSATNTAQISAMNTYLAYPLVTLVFGVSVVVAGIYAIVRLVYWLAAKIANLTNWGKKSDGMTNQW